MIKTSIFDLEIFVYILVRIKDDIVIGYAVDESDIKYLNDLFPDQDIYQWHRYLYASHNRITDPVLREDLSNL